VVGPELLDVAEELLLLGGVEVVGVGGVDIPGDQPQTLDAGLDGDVFQGHSPFEEVGQRTGRLAKAAVGVLVGPTVVGIHQDHLAAPPGKPDGEAVAHQAFARAALAPAHSPDLHRRLLKVVTNLTEAPAPPTIRHEWMDGPIPAPR